MKSRYRCTLFHVIHPPCITGTLPEIMFDTNLSQGFVLADASDEFILLCSTSGCVRKSKCKLKKALVTEQQ